MLIPGTVLYARTPDAVVDPSAFVAFVASFEKSLSVGPSQSICVGSYR